MFNWFKVKKNIEFEVRVKLLTEKLDNYLGTLIEHQRIIDDLEELKKYMYTLPEWEIGEDLMDRAVDILIEKEKNICVG